jgi:hypothetical protein
VIRTLLASFSLFATTLASSTHSQQITLPMTEKDGLVRVTIMVNDAPKMFVIDTGSMASMVTPGASGLSKKEMTKLRKVRVYGVAGMQDAAVVSVKLSLGDKTFHADVIVSDLPIILPGCDGVLGNNVLSHFQKIELDYKAQTLRLWK